MPFVSPSWFSEACSRRRDSDAPTYALSILYRQASARLLLKKKSTPCLQSRTIDLARVSLVVAVAFTLSCSFYRAVCL